MRSCLDTMQTMWFLFYNMHNTTTCGHNHANRLGEVSEYSLNVCHPGVLNDRVKAWMCHSNATCTHCLALGMSLFGRRQWQLRQQVSVEVRALMRNNKSSLPGLTNTWWRASYISLQKWSVVLTTEWLVAGDSGYEKWIHILVVLVACLLWYRNESNHPIIWTPPFSRKND